MFSYDQRQYVRQQSIGEVIRNTFEIYKNFFSEFFLTYLVIAVLPGILWKYLVVKYFLIEPDGTTNTLVSISIFIFMTMLASALMTIMVSDVCVSNYPGAKRALNHMSGRLWGELLITNLIYYSFLVGLVWISYKSGLFGWLHDSIIKLASYLLHDVLGLEVSFITDGFRVGIIYNFIFSVLLLIPFIWFMFYPVIVVLEGKWGIKAFIRSFTLGWRYHIRNYIVQFVLFFLIYVISRIMQSLMMLVLVRTSTPAGIAFLSLVLDIVVSALAPLNIICLVLLYYDLRVRKEAYDNATLAEDLRH